MKLILIKLSRALMLGLILSACIPFAANAKVILSPKSVTVEVGKTATINVKGTKKKIKWSSKNKKIAIVKKGVITGINAGNTVITAKVGKKKYRCNVTVMNPVSIKPSLAKTTINMLAGEITCVEVNNYSGRLICESSNKEVAVVANNGTILGKDYGTAIITVNAGGTILKCTVNVSIPTPKCYPNNGGLLSENVTINSFSLTFAGYDPKYCVEDPKTRLYYFYPYKYHLKMNGKTPGKGSVTIRFTFSGTNGYESIPANNFISFETGDKGTFNIDQYVLFSQFGDRVFATGDFYTIPELN